MVKAAAAPKHAATIKPAPVKPAPVKPAPAAAPAPKTPAAPTADVLVLGSHPACYLAAALLTEEGVAVVHATIPSEPANDRLVLINPKFFELHKSLAAVKRELELSPIYGLRFLADSAGVHSEHVGKSVAGYVASSRDVLQRIVELARQRDVPMLSGAQVQLHGVDEHGVDVSIDGVRLRPKLLIVGGFLPEPQKKMLGLPLEWDAEVPHRYTYLKLGGTHWTNMAGRSNGNGNGNGGGGGTGAGTVMAASDPGAVAGASAGAAGKSVVAMSLDLKGRLSWAWLMQGVHDTQLSVEQPLNTPQLEPGPRLIEHWANVLKTHGVLRPETPIDPAAAVSMDLPFAGALSQEGVANRTLLIGPAGGFYTACGEDIYPNCWSALFAVDVAKRAVKERHLQDALRAYREKWGSTLGDYLRGPQQNLRFLLPLVYRNPVMTTRLSEAILTGASVVR